MKFEPLWPCCTPSSGAFFCNLFVSCRCCLSCSCSDTLSVSCSFCCAVVVVVIAISPSLFPLEMSGQCNLRPDSEANKNSSLVSFDSLSPGPIGLPLSSELPMKFGFPLSPLSQELGDQSYLPSMCEQFLKAEIHPYRFLVVIPWMNRIHFAPPKKPWFRMIPP